MEKLMRSCGQPIPFLDDYTQCELPPRGFIQFISKVLVLRNASLSSSAANRDASRGGHDNVGDGTSKANRHSNTRPNGWPSRRCAVAKDQIDRGYIVSFEGDKAFNTIVASASSAVFSAHDSAKKGVKKGSTRLAVGNVSKGAHTVNSSGNSGVEGREGACGEDCDDDLLDDDDDDDEDCDDEGDDNVSSSSCVSPSAARRLEKVSAYRLVGSSSTGGSARRSGSSSSSSSSSSCNSLSDDDSADDAPVTFRDFGCSERGIMHSSSLLTPNCRVVSLIPRDPLNVSAFRMIMTTTQVFPSEPLVCCPASVDRSMDEMKWAAAQWALADYEKYKMTATEGEGSVATGISHVEKKEKEKEKENEEEKGVAKEEEDDSKSGYGQGQRRIMAPCGVHSSISAAPVAAPPPAVHAVSIPRDVVEARRKFLSTPQPIGPYWPKGVTYYHGIGETHRDGDGGGGKGGGGPPIVESAKMSKNKTASEHVENEEPNGYGTASMDGAGARNDDGTRTETEERKGVTCMLAYPYNMLRLQPCPAMGAGQLEVVAAIPIPAYTCFAYSGPVVDIDQHGRPILHADDSPPLLENSGGTREGEAPHIHIQHKSSSSLSSSSSPVPTPSPYLLTLRHRTMVSGQGISRYFNHRYRADLFGNAQFSSVSVPTRAGMTIEVRRGVRVGGGGGRGLTQKTVTRGKGKTTTKKKALPISKAKGGRKRPRTPTPPPRGNERQPVDEGDDGGDGDKDSDIEILGTSNNNASKSTPSLPIPLPSVMSIPFFVTTRDIAAGEPILATSYGTAYDAQLERSVFGAGDEGPLPPYLQRWWAKPRQEEGGLVKKEEAKDDKEGVAATNSAANKAFLRPRHSDYEGEFRWDVRSGDIVVRVFNEEEQEFFRERWDREGAGVGGGGGGGSRGLGISRVSIVRDVDQEANVLLIAPLVPRVVSPLSDRRSFASVGKAVCPREYLIPEFPEDDRFRAIVHYRTVAPLYDEDDYVGVRVGVGGGANGAVNNDSGGGRVQRAAATTTGAGSQAGKKLRVAAPAQEAPLVSIHLKPSVAELIGSFPAPGDGDDEDCDGDGMCGSAGDCALDECLWPLFAGYSSAEAVQRSRAGRGTETE